MKFGKELQTHQEETLPEWRDKFLCYKPLKKLLKNLPATAADSFPPDHIPFRIQQLPINDAGALDGQDQPVIGLQEWFVRILNEELEKFNDFYVDKEEEFVIRFQELKERIDKLKKKSSRGVALTSESEFSREMMDIRKDLVTIHGEMVLLKNYSSLNFAGLIKILKKHDKRTGGLLCLPFTQLALHQPFFTTEPLTRLVRECEANLELLFPMQAEIIESDPNPDDRTSPSLNGTTNSSYETPTLGEETMEVYRSTLAAMRTIRGLQKASSSYNPLSFSAIFGNQNRESGTATAEDSASRSPAALPKG